MPIEVYAFDVTTPVGTLKTAPLLSNLTMPARIVRQVDIRIPAGCRGVVGFALAAAGNPILPVNPGAWIVGDNELIPWPLVDQITSGAWQVLTYNLGKYAHTLEFRFQCDLPGPVSADALPVIPAASIAPTADAGLPALPALPDLPPLPVLPPDLSGAPPLVPFGPGDQVNRPGRLRPGQGL
jgi:hypothetical protein